MIFDKIEPRRFHFEIYKFLACMEYYTNLERDKNLHINFPIQNIPEI